MKFVAKCAVPGATVHVRFDVFADSAELALDAAKIQASRNGWWLIACNAA